MEWYKDFEETDPQHRHLSHLFGLYPGRQLSLTKNPEFFNAARRSLELRGDGGTGWSKGWKINWWARLLDGDHAYMLIRQLLHMTNQIQRESSCLQDQFYLVELILVMPKLILIRVSLKEISGKTFPPTALTCMKEAAGGRYYLVDVNQSFACLIQLKVFKVL